MIRKAQVKNATSYLKQVKMIEDLFGVVSWRKTDHVNVFNSTDNSRHHDSVLGTKFMKKRNLS